MTKHRIKHIRMELENGTIIEHDGGVFNHSHNCRLVGKGSSKIEAEWWEHVVTWHTAIDNLEQAISDNPDKNSVGKQDRETLRGKAWCSVHGMECGECFSQHVSPTAFAGRKNEWTAKDLEDTTARLKNTVTLDWGLDGFIQKGYRNGDS